MKIARKGRDDEMALSTLFFVNGEKKVNLCEDSYAIGAHDGVVLLSVFDGCGGSGAKVYDTYGGHTGDEQGTYDDLECEQCGKTFTVLQLKLIAS